jgi:hypothetical protein
LFRAFYQVGAHRISLHVTEHRQEMVVLLNRERLETALPDVAAAVIMLVVTAYMGIKQPMHPPAQVTIRLRQDHQVEVVGHQAETQDRHRHLDARMRQGFEEGLIVVLLVENRALTVAPVDDVVANTANRGSRSAWHGR